LQKSTVRNIDDLSMFLPTSLREPPTLG